MGQPGTGHWEVGRQGEEMTDEKRGGGKGNGCFLRVSYVILFVITQQGET